ncbi:hypothetical protein [Oceanicella sp. SM1341]|uniref:hypothetical protein n=1 Tax=Oceanicella sp. SM1341 TaxID=1548889 RepID=UPI000E51A996|nr:hypothetical protein [Oceanicella sp. SM1341]
MSSSFTIRRDKDGAHHVYEMIHHGRHETQEAAADQVVRLVEGARRSCVHCRGRGFVSWHPRWDNGCMPCPTCRPEKEER